MGHTTRLIAAMSDVRAVGAASHVVLGLRRVCGWRSVGVELARLLDRGQFWQGFFAFRQFHLRRAVDEDGAEALALVSHVLGAVPVPVGDPGDARAVRVAVLSLASRGRTLGSDLVP